MDRRQFLAAAGPALLAGCPGDSGSETTDRPTDRKTDDPEPSPTANPAGGTPTAPRTRASTDARTPTAAPTPEPTAPSPTTATPTPTATPQEPVEFSGRGNSTRAVDVVDGLTIIDGVYEGSGEFAVTLYPTDDGTVRRFFHTSGPHDGASADLLEGGSYRIEVTAEKTYWSLTVRQPRPTSGKSLPVYLDESGSDVFGPYEFGDGTTTAAASHGHGGSFLMQAWPLAGDFPTVVFDKTGRFAGERSFDPPDLGYVEVTSGGDWTLGLRSE